MGCSRGETWEMRGLCGHVLLNNICNNKKSDLEKFAHSVYSLSMPWLIRRIPTHGLSRLNCYHMTQAQEVWCYFQVHG